VGKFTATERSLVKSIVATLSIKRRPEAEIIEEVYDKTNKTISRVTLFNIRKSIKKESFDWWTNLARSDNEFIHEYKERINEIIWLQRKHHELIDRYPDDTKVLHDSLAELHKLNITLSNYFDVAPEMSNRQAVVRLRVDYDSQLQKIIELQDEIDRLKSPQNPLRITNDEKEEESPLREFPQESIEEKEETKTELICYCGDGEIMNHFECGKCNHVWCPEDKSIPQQSCPNCSVSSS